MSPLSVVVITYNEERNIGRCLESVADITDDIVVVDSFSTDATEAICRSHPVRFIRHPWEGYSASKNFANGQARHDRILSIDADEALSPELRRSIADLAAESAVEAGKFKRLTNYCGHWIRYGGWYPDIKVRIFDRTRTQWCGSIHESLDGIDEKKAVLLAGDCYHYTCYTIAEHLSQMRTFTDLMAEDGFRRGKRPSLARLFFSPASKFIRDYCLRLGFLDGKNGLVIAVLSAYATYLKYSKLRALHSGNTLTGISS
jgi:glycosyltransferase involved in cell wall biosynthesis